MQVKVILEKYVSSNNLDLHVILDIQIAENMYLNVNIPCFYIAFET